MKNFCILISNSDKLIIEDLNKNETLDILEKTYSSLKKSSRIIYMLKIIKYLNLLNINQDIINLYTDLYNKLILVIDPKKDIYNKILKSDEKIPNYIKLYCYFQLNLHEILVLNKSEKMNFIKDKETKIFINIIENTIDLIDEGKTIKITASESATILKLFLEISDEEIIKLIENNNILNKKLSELKCSCVFQRKNKPLSIIQIRNAYQNFVKTNKY